MPTATQTPFVFLPPEPRETEENNGFFSFFNLPPSTSSGTGQDTNPNILWGVAAAAALGAFNAVIAEKKRKEAEAREKRAQNNNSNHTKRRAAEKAGTLGAYIREIRKERAAQVKAKVASILHKEEKKKDEKLREKSGLSEKEWKKKQARQARWDANGAIEYEVKKERIIRKETWKEKALNFKEQLLNPPPSPPEPSLAEVQARMAKEKQLEQEQTLADWKEADMVAASRAVIAQEEDETLSQAENNQEEETLLDKIFGWLDTWKSVLQQGQEDTGISVEPVDTGGLSECLIPIGFQDAPPDDIHYAFQEIGSQELESPAQEYVANAWVGNYLEQPVYGMENQPPVEAHGDPPIEVEEGVFVSVHEVNVNDELVHTMYIENGGTLTLHIAEQLPSGDWVSVEQVGEITERHVDCE